MRFILSNQTLSTLANSDPRREYVEPVNSTCLQETVKQWLICKQHADICNKKYVFCADEAGQFSWHVCLRSFIDMASVAQQLRLATGLLEVLFGYLNVVPCKIEDDCSSPATPHYTPLGTPP